MTHQPPSDPKTADVRVRLQQLARLLRQTAHLEPDTQQELAGLLDELSGSLNPTLLSSVEVSHLAESTSHLAQALHQGHPEKVEAARKRVEAAATRAAPRAPAIADLVQRLLDGLANLGI